MRKKTSRSSRIAGLTYLDISEPFFLKPHVVAFTNRSLRLIQLSIPDYRRKRLALVGAREAVSVVRARETWFYFSVWVRRVGGADELRLNFPFSSWEKDARTLVSALGYETLIPREQSGSQPATTHKPRVLGP